VTANTLDTNLKRAGHAFIYFHTVSISLQMQFSSSIFGPGMHTF